MPNPNPYPYPYPNLILIITLTMIPSLNPQTATTAKKKYSLSGALDVCVVSDIITHGH